MRIDQFTEWSFAHDLQAPDAGDAVCFQVTRPSKEANTYCTDLWYYNDERGLRRLTSSGKDGAAIFLRDGRLLFHSTRENPEKPADKTPAKAEKAPAENAENEKKPPRTTTFWQIAPDGGEATHAFDLPLQVQGLRECAEGVYIFTGCPGRDPKEEWIEIEDLPFWFNGADYTAGNRTALYRCHFDAEKAPKWELLTEENEVVGAWDLSPSGRYAVFCAAHFDKVMALREKVFCLDLETGVRTQLTEDEFSVQSVLFDVRDETENAIFLVAAKGESHGINEDPMIYGLNRSNNSLEKICDASFDVSPGGSVNSDARFGGGSVFQATAKGLQFIATVGDHAHLLRLEEDGSTTARLAEDGSVECFKDTDNGLFFIAMRGLQLPEVYLKRGADVECLTDFSAALAKTPLAPIETFAFSSNGSVFTGYVIKPLHYDPEKTYPGLLEVHGGPKTVFGTLLHHEMQYFASQDYFVFYTNPHGSDGHGIAFSDIRGKYGTIDYKDLMTFTDAVLDRYPALDPKRLGVLGGSYGGFMTNWIIGHTDRFAAANAQRSISNWISFYGVSDIGFYFSPDQTVANPWDSLEACWKQSPLKYARSVKTPTLFIHSDHDLRCPLEQGLQMYTAIKEQGVDSRIVVFKEETHELSRSGRPKGRIKRLEEISRWFAHYLKGEDVE